MDSQKSIFKIHELFSFSSDYIIYRFCRLSIGPLYNARILCGFPFPDYFVSCSYSSMQAVKSSIRVACSESSARESGAGQYQRLGLGRRIPVKSADLQVGLSGCTPLPFCLCLPQEEACRIEASFTHFLFRRFPFAPDCSWKGIRRIPVDRLVTGGMLDQP
jgi:hypothetical protein